MFDALPAHEHEGIENCIGDSATESFSDSRNKEYFGV